MDHRIPVPSRTSDLAKPQLLPEMNMQRSAIFALLVAMLLLAGCGGSDDGTPAAPRIDSPTNLRATVLSVTSVRLEWTDNTSNENGFIIERAPAGASNWAVIDTADMDAIRFTDGTLTEGNSYNYRVSAYVGSHRSTPAGPIPASTPLIAPTRLAATLHPIRSDVVYLTWTDGSQVETGYALESRIAGEDYALLAELDAGATAYTDSGVAVNQRIYYRVRAMKDTLASPWSNESSLRTNLRTPTPPSDLIAQGGAARPNAAALTWSDNAESEDGYVIEVSSTGSSDWSVADSLGAGSYRANVTGLTADQTLFFRVYAWNAYGNSAYSNIASCEIAGPPAAPSNLTAEAPTFHAVLLAWADNASSETGFQIQRRDNPGVIWTHIVSLAVDATNFADSLANPNRSYAYRIRAFNGSGNSAWSNEATVTTPSGPPVAPRNLNVGGIDNQVDKMFITWEDRSDDEDGFFIERRGPGEQRFSLVAVTEPNISVLTDTALTPETWYSYRVRAHNAIGYSSYCQPDSGQTTSLTVFSTSFEGNEAIDYTPNDPPPAPWVLQRSGSSYVEVSNARSHDGSQSLVFHDPDVGANFASALLNRYSVTEATWSAWLFIPPSSHFGLMGGDRNNLITFQVQFNENNTFLVRNGGTLLSVQGYPTARWFKMDLVFSASASKWILKFDDQAVTDTLGLQLTDHLPTNQFIMLAYNDEEIPDGFVDEYAIIRPLNPPGAPRRWGGGAPAIPVIGRPVTIDDAIRAVRGGGPQR